MTDPACNLTYSDREVTRVLSEYLPPKLLKLVLTELRGSVECIDAPAKATDEDRARARRYMRNWGL